jgi:peptidoglycan hydrolase-like protein with peptidoglycan-binding domain
MINYYDYPAEKNVQLSEHFSVDEFVPWSDYEGDFPPTVPVDFDLIDVLENIYDFFGCECAVISSGYRTPACDVAVGGSGSGYHTKGMAADVAFYKDGQQIHSRLIACYAQDIGVKGIGYRCGGAENWTHLDTRSEGVWYGDETDYSSGHNDFYGYTGTTKAEIYTDGQYIENHSSGSQSSGSVDVKTVQGWLNSKYGAGLDVDGIYGSLTKAALVAALQTELGGLDVDGIFGYYTKGAVRNLSNGDSGNLVYILQGLLLCNGYGAGGFDGVFGSGTEAAVTAYQYQHALDADGIAGQQTFESLCS